MGQFGKDIMNLLIFFLLKKMQEVGYEGQCDMDWHGKLDLFKLNSFGGNTTKYVLERKAMASRKRDISN